MPSNGLVFIASQTVSSVSSVSFDNCFSSAYTHYLIRARLVASVSDKAISGALRSGGSDERGTNYNHQRVQAWDTSFNGARSTGTATILSEFVRTDDTGASYNEAWLINPYDALPTSAWSDKSRTNFTAPWLRQHAYLHTLSTSYDGFSLLVVTDTFSGTVSVHGLVNS